MKIQKNLLSCGFFAYLWKVSEDRNILAHAVQALRSISCQFRGLARLDFAVPPATVAYLPVRYSSLDSSDRHDWPVANEWVPAPVSHATAFYSGRAHLASEGTTSSTDLPALLNIAFVDGLRRRK